MTSSIVLFAVFFIAVAWFVVSPLYNDSKTDLGMFLDDVSDTQRILQQKRSDLMLTLRDMDFDFETGKLSKEDYQGLRSKYEQETIEVLRQIDNEKDEWDQFQKQLDEKIKSV